MSSLSFYCCTSQKLSGRPVIFLLPGPDYTPQIKVKTAAAILAVEQRLLSYNPCRGFLILRSDNFSRLLHLPEPIELVGSKSRGIALLAGKFLHLLLLLTGASSNRMMHNFVQKRCELTNCYFFVLKSDKAEGK